MAREKNTEQRRAQIVEGLAVVMAEKGFAGASVQAIAKAAGLTPGLVHYHFNRKLEILLALVDEMRAQLERRIDRAVQKTGTAEAALHAHVDAFVRTGPDAAPRAVACWVVVCAAALREQEVATVVNAVLTSEKKAIEKRLLAVWDEREASVDAASTDRIATGILAGIQGAFALASVAPSAFAPGFASPTLSATTRALIDEATR